MRECVLALDKNMGRHIKINAVNMLALDFKIYQLYLNVEKFVNIFMKDCQICHKFIYASNEIDKTL